MLQDSDTHTVTVKGEATKVRDLQIEDHTGKMRVTLWRGATNIPPATGRAMLLKYVSVDTTISTNATYFQSTQKQTLRYTT